MLTREDVLQAVKGGRESRCLDGRDYSRLVDFFPVTDWEAFGFGLKDVADGDSVEPKDFTEENVKARLETDVAFGFEKALGQRGLSAAMMNEVVKMWMWILEDPLQDHCDYTQYGLPLLKAVAVKYGFGNQIGDDEGGEDKYACEDY